MSPEDCLNCEGEDYRGHRNTTERGYICQRWDSQEPHRHDYSPTEISLTYSHNWENYCRNADGRYRPWCYTTSSSKEWDYCYIPLCSKKIHFIVLFFVFFILLKLYNFYTHFHRCE
uniref:Kringle domain-containing protein n=1 Tax=Kryptolebias marmoratus TaxID=37003 RepID=A0A3Q3BAF5_KRYMA